jgi:hypothetical protein
MRGLGNMSSDGWTERQTEGHNGDSMLPQIFFGEHKNKTKQTIFYLWGWDGGWGWFKMININNEIK